MKRRTLLGFGGLATASLLVPLLALSLAPSERTYSVNLTGDSRIALGAAQRIRFQLRGTLRLTDAPDQKVIGRLEQPEVTLWQEDKINPSESKKLERALASPFVMQKSTNGTIATVAFSSESPEGARQTLRALLAFYQASPKQSTRETDLAGPCEVAYSPKAKNTWEKRIVRYIPVPDAMTEHQPAGAQTVTFDPAGSVDTISGTRTVKTLLGSREVAVSTLTGSIRQIGRSTVHKQATISALGKAEPLNAGADPKEQQRQRYTATLGEDTPSSLLSALEKLPADAPTGVSNALYLKLRALLALQPESAAQFDSYLAMAKSDSAGMSALLDAIREVGSPQAQASLIKTIKVRTNDSAFTDMALPVLGLTARPLKETEALLRQLSERSDNIGGQAKLLLGSLVNTLQTQEPARSKRLLEELILRLKTDTHEPDTLVTLAALGNTGAPELLPHLAPWLSNTSIPQRCAAVSALRLIPGPEAERQLRNVLQNDTESSVRANAAFALSFLPRSSAARDALKKALKDSSKEVAEAAKRALASLPEK